MKIFELGGWETILPEGLSDYQLGSLADRLRGFLWDEGELKPGEMTTAANTLALLLLTKVNPSCIPFHESFPWGGKERLVREILTVLHIAVHQEIVNRLLSRPSDVELLALQTGICAELMSTPHSQSALRRGAELIEKCAQKLHRQMLSACCCARCWFAAAGNKNACALP